MNTKVYLIAILVAGALIGISLFLFLRVSGTRDIPKATSPNPHPTSRLVVPRENLALTRAA